MFQSMSLPWEVCVCVCAGDPGFQWPGLCFRAIPLDRDSLEAGKGKSGFSAEDRKECALSGLLPGASYRGCLPRQHGISSFPFVKKPCDLAGIYPISGKREKEGREGKSSVPCFMVSL